MKYAKAINEFKAGIREAYKNSDCSKPKRGTKELKIIVEERENGSATVWLKYDEEFIRMFGKINTVWTKVYEGDLKTACGVARELKAETKLAVKFWKYEPIEMLAY